MQRIDEVELRALRLPYSVPYWSTLATLTHLDVMVAVARMSDGREGYGEAAVITGYTHETPEGAWAYARDVAPTLPGATAEEAMQRLLPHQSTQSHAVTCLVSAIEMACGFDVLEPAAVDREVELLAPVHAHDLKHLPSELDDLLEAGYRVLKVKVGQEVESDLERVRLIGRHVRGHARLRLDANQGYAPDDGCRFAAALDPESVELFEQACHMDDWDAACRVRSASAVPVMLDESISDIEDIDRAAERQCADLIKMKLVKAGGLGRLRATLQAVHAHGMRAVLGNGVASDIGNWMEACISQGIVETVGEMNGFLKPRDRLFENPLEVRRGKLLIPRGYAPRLDRKVVQRYTQSAARYTAAA